MFKSLSYKLLMLSALLLTAFVGIFGFIEYKKISTDKQVEILASTPITSLAFRLENAALHAKYVLARNNNHHKKEDATTVKDFRNAYETLKKFEALMAAFLLDNPLKAEGFIAEIDRLNMIRANMQVIDGRIAGEKRFKPSTLNEINSRLQSILDITHDLGVRVEASHHAELNLFLKEFSEDKNNLALLSIFIILCGFGLIIVLIDAVYHFKSNAERAQAAEKTNALFAAALQSTRVGVMITDMRKEDRPIVFINSSFTRMTGYALSDIESGNRDFLFGWNTDQASIASYKRAINLHETATIDFSLYRLDGTPFWGEVHLSPVLDANNKLAYYVSLFNDITVFRQTQEDLIHAKTIAEQASKVKTNFLAMMSHEIRTPINGILGVIKLMDETPVNEEQKHLLGIARTSSSALNNIINDILDYAKMEAGKTEIINETFSLRTLINDVIDFSTTLVGDKSVGLAMSLQDTTPDFYHSDIGKLRQVLLNLISNSIKFTDKGSVTVSAFSMVENDVNGKPGHLIRFEIQDTGIGISSENLSKLFKEFTQVERSFTRRFGGSGLGLAICKRLIKALDGEIGVESQLGKGTKFWFMLPLQLANETDLIQTQVDSQNSGKDYVPANKENKVLLVEDNDTNRLVVSKFLNKLNLTVDEACNGVEAIDMSDVTDYDLILMDVSMPEMDGMQATCQIRALGKHNMSVPIVALTAHVMEGDREMCLAAGMNDYLNKPVEYSDLKRTLSRWMKVSFPDDSSTLAKPTASLSQEPKTEETGPTAKKHPKADILIDKSILERMSDALDPEVVDAVAKSFLKDSKERIKGFDDRNNVDVVQNTAHTLKSSSANCGLFKFSYLMNDIEMACRKGDPAFVEKILSTVPDIYEEACQALEEARKEIAG